MGKKLTPAQKRGVLKAMRMIENNFEDFSCNSVENYAGLDARRLYENFFSDYEFGIRIREVTTTIDGPMFGPNESLVQRDERAKQNRLTMLALFLAAEGEL